MIKKVISQLITFIMSAYYWFYGFFFPFMVVLFNIILIMFLEYYAIPKLLYPEFVREHYLRFFSIVIVVTAFFDLFMIVITIQKYFNFHIDFSAKVFDLFSYLVSALILGVALSKVKDSINIMLLQSFALAVYPANGAIRFYKLWHTPKKYKEKGKNEISKFKKTNAHTEKSNYHPHRKYK
ncbi:hypothetical protein [Enterococcus sp. BWR-S5]|uniref:hypothetical protein n=1 Tax=Enterococcus sp. BWR-S5 TaxID=2787714 RepID=UPI001924A217|nr:hypothetical protein [Enterococcus sp. BWR-S5]MBL1226304.1 hypothetical protein [Enterococcus sp. BWR-S5]